MILNGFRVISKQIKKEYQNNIISNSEQNVSNWTGSGSGTVSINYEDNINDISFSNDGTLFSKSYSLSTDLSNSGTYIIKFKACSPSGFASSVNNNVIVTVDSVNQACNISNTASNDLTEYELLVSARNNITIKLDLEQMVNTSSDVTLEISDIGIYEISGPGGLRYWKDHNDNVITDENNDGFVFI